MWLNRRKPLVVQGQKLYFDTKWLYKQLPYEENICVRLSHDSEISVYEDNIAIASYYIEPLEANANLENQYLHICVCVLENYALMIDGIISKSKTEIPAMNNPSTEGIRFQPRMIGPGKDINNKLIGMGLFKRGLHYGGIITPSNVRLVCICDSCGKSFGVQSFHAGFSNCQYFYSSNSQETLLVPYGLVDDMPGQLAKVVDKETLKNVESKLPKSQDGEYRYYNSFCCPHCRSAYIDFARFPEERMLEYYGNTYVNKAPKMIDSA